MAQAVVTPVTACRLCGEQALEPAIELASTPIGDKFVTAAQTGEIQPDFTVRLMLCQRCGQVQLSEIIDPGILYGDYCYTTSVSVGLPGHFASAATAILRDSGASTGDLAVELGSNQGVMLRAFREQGLRVLGVDPATEIAQRATESGVETLPGFFTQALAQKIAAERGKAAIILANNVIANIPDLDDVARGIRELLSDRGVFVFETSYLLDVVRKHLIDTIYHEHISYLAIRPLQAFFRRHGLALVDAERIPTKGGSLRGMVRHAGAGFKETTRLKTLLAAETDAGIFEPTAYHELDADIARLGRKLVQTAAELRARNESVVCYGATAGPLTMLYSLGLKGLVNAFVDDNPDKIGKFSPGLHIPVHDSDWLYQCGAKTVIVLAWRYIDAITARHSRFLEQGGRFLVVDLPGLELVEIGRPSHGAA